MAEDKLERAAMLVRTYVQQNDWSITRERMIQSGYQFRVIDGANVVMIDCYTNGNVSVRGPESELKTALQIWWQQQKPSFLSSLIVEQDIPPTALHTVNVFRVFAQEQGWSVQGKPIHEGIYQLRIAHEQISVPIDIYPTGTVLIQGNENKIKITIQEWWNQQQRKIQPLLWDVPMVGGVSTPSVALMPIPAKRMISNSISIVPHIGTDEAGKGSYFGPLVVAGVYVDEQAAAQLLALGVRDSKLLRDKPIEQMAAEIKRICQGQGHVLSYNLERYNRVYQETNNLNLLLAKAHAQVIVQLQQKVSCTIALVDQFSDEPLVNEAVHVLGNEQIIVEQRPRAEDDIAVAAASIVARAEFVRLLESLSKKYGIVLPKGASDAAVISAGRVLVKRYGRDILTKVAKLHFKTTQAILENV